MTLHSGQCHIVNRILYVSVYIHLLIVTVHVCIVLLTSDCIHCVTFRAAKVYLVTPDPPASLEKTYVRLDVFSSVSVIVSPFNWSFFAVYCVNS